MKKLGFLGVFFLLGLGRSCWGWVDAAKQLIERGDRVAAEAYLRSVRAANISLSAPDEFRILLLRALLLADQKNHDQASRVLNEARTFWHDRLDSDTIFAAHLDLVEQDLLARGGR